MVIIILIAAIILIILVYGVLIYNNLVRLRETVKEAWSQIQVQLKRRHDLIPNLVNTAKGYLTHERETLENVMKARAQALAPGGTAEISEKESILSRALSRLLAVVENYPDLKANETMLELMENLRSTEERIAYARQRYNDIVRIYNTKIEQFPYSIIANQYHFRKFDFLEIEKSDTKVPEVKF